MSKFGLEERGIDLYYLDIVKISIKKYRLSIKELVHLVASQFNVSFY